MTVLVEALKTIRYFQGLTDQEIETIKSYISEKSIEKDKVFINEGEWSEYLYFVIDGIVKVFKSFPDGRDQILKFSLPGDSLNDVSIFDGLPTVASMISMTKCELYTIRKENIKTVLAVNPRISLNIMRSLANRIRHESNLVGDLTSNHVPNRLAKLLIGRYAGDKSTMGIFLDQQDMAAMIGARREVVNRSLKSMEKEGFIKISPIGVKIINRDKLSQFAGDYEIDQNNYYRDPIEYLA